MKNTSILLPIFAGSLALGGCVAPSYPPGPTVYQPGPATYESGPAYEQGEASADVYYVDERPYSRQYGPLLYRDDRYYYNRGGNYVVYDRPVRVYHTNERRVVVRDDRDRDRDRTTRVVVQDDRDHDRDRDRDRNRNGNDRDRDQDRRPPTNVVVKPAEERKRATNPAVIQQVERDRQRPNPTDRAVPAAPPQQSVAAQRRQAALEKAKEQARDKKKQKKDKDDDETQQN